MRLPTLGTLVRLGLSSAPVVLMAGVAGCVVPSIDDGELVTMEDRACSGDDRCIVAEAICDCNSYGGNIAIRADAETAVAARRDELRPETACSSALSDDASCDASRAECVAGVCELMAP